MSEAGRMWLSSFTGQEEDNIQILPLKLSPTLGQWCGQIITSVYIHVISKQVDIRVSLMRSVIIISQNIKYYHDATATTKNKTEKIII